MADKTVGERLERYFHDHGEQLKLPPEIPGRVMMACEKFASVEVAAKLREVADKLADGHSCESNECWTCSYIDKLTAEADALGGE